ncbi:MAG: NADH-quinone oxidoreductase subunit H [Chitinivibrionales bacterium]|nr:NADH-quinone oxidoreductase subunit H [Chitinivibrionales bacterium]
MMNSDWMFLGTTTARAVFMWGLTLVFILINIFLERKICAFVQDRVGPNRAHICGVRLFGFILNFADAVKLIFKEDILPPFVNKAYYIAAPAVIMTIALMGAAVVPFADDLTVGGFTLPMQALNLNVGFLYILALTSLSVYSLVLAGWGSNSKYPLLSAMRSSAQMISYEISMGLSLVGLVMVFGSVDLGQIVKAQGGLIAGVVPRWGIVVQPLGALLFAVASLAELNRTPFDLPEGESEIIGFHVEYSSMKFALFFMAEYANIFVASAVFAALFLGGWQIPWLTTAAIKEHAAPVFRTVSIVALAAMMAVAALLVRFYRKRPYQWKDLRRIEGPVLLSALGLGALLAVAGIVASYVITPGPIMAALLACGLQMAAFCGKSFFLCAFVILVRWTLPRLRYDQLMALGWKIMLPLGLANLLVTGLVLLLKKG